MPLHSRPLKTLFLSPELSFPTLALFPWETLPSGFWEPFLSPFHQLLYVPTMLSNLHLLVYSPINSMSVYEVPTVYQAQCYSLGPQK